MAAWAARWLWHDGKGTFIRSIESVLNLGFRLRSREDIGRECETILPPGPIRCNAVI
jgi:hypothetical protein